MTARRSEFPFFVCAMAVSLLLLSTHLLLPLSGDNEIYQSMATDLFQFHAVPYLGSWDQNFPGIVYLHWLSIVLFGNSAFGFQCFDLLVHLAMSVFLYRILRRWIPAFTASLAIVVWNFHYLSEGFSGAGQRDSFVCFFLLLGTSFLFKINRSTTRAILYSFLAGLAIAMTSAIRFTYLPFLLISALYLWMTNKRCIVPFLTGICVLFAAMIVPYCIVPDGLAQFYNSTIAFNAVLYGPLRASFHEIVMQLLPQKAFLAIALLGIAGMIFSRKSIFSLQIPVLPRAERMLVLGYGMTAFFSLVVMGRYWPYHFEPLMLALLPIGTIIILTLLRAIPLRTVRIAAGCFIIGYFAFRVFPQELVRPFFVEWFRGAPNAIVLAQAQLEPEPGFILADDAAVAAFIERSMPQGERFECASRQAGVRWRTQRQSATRYTTFYALAMTTPDGAHPEFQQRWRNEYIDSLFAIRPYYLILNNQPMGFSDHPMPAPLVSIHQIDGFDSRIIPMYSIDTTIGGYEIMKRK